MVQCWSIAYGALQHHRRAGFTYAQHCLPLLLDAVSEAPHPPSLIFTGATASLKASAQFASFASGKFALRALGQSLAREFGPRGVHVAHVIIDGLIDTPRARGFAGKDQVMISPDAVSDEYFDNVCRYDADKFKQNRSPKVIGTCILRISLRLLKS